MLNIRGGNLCKSNHVIFVACHKRVMSNFTKYGSDTFIIMSKNSNTDTTYLINR